MTTPSEYFPTDTAGLPAARSPEVVEFADGDEFDLRIAPVAKQLGGGAVRMLAYNGSVPGPILRVQQGSELVVIVWGAFTRFHVCVGPVSSVGPVALPVP